MARGEEQNLGLTTEAERFVRWFEDRYKEILGRPIDPEPFEESVRIAKLMLDEIDFADAGGRALMFIESRRREREDITFSLFCIYALRNLDGLNDDVARSRRLERIIEVNFILSQGFRENLWRYAPNDGISVKQTNQTNREKAKEYSLGELEYLAAQLLEQYGTPDAIPKGVKQKLEKSRQ